MTRKEMIIKIKTYKKPKKFSSYQGGNSLRSISSRSQYTDPRYEKVEVLRIHERLIEDDLISSRRYYVAACINHLWCSLKAHIEQGRLPHSTVAEELYETYQEAEEAIKLLASRYNAKIIPTRSEILANIANPPSRPQTVARVKSNASDDLVVYDGANADAFTGTEPFFCDLCGKDFAQNTWAKTFCSIVEHEIKCGNPVLEKLKYNSLTGDPSRPFFLQCKMESCRCILLSNNYWINVNHSADQIVRYIERFWLLCGYKQKDIAISGVSKEVGLRKEEKNTAAKSRAQPSNSDIPKVISPEMKALKERLIDLLTVKFKYGFRVGSAIDLKRLRMFAEAEGLSLPEDDETFTTVLKETGVALDEKIYPITQSQIDEVSYFADSAFATGITALWTELFFEQNAEWMRERGVVSAEVMQRVLEVSEGRYSFRKNFFTQGEKKTEAEAVMDEVYRVTGDERFVVMSELIERLPHIPNDRILPHLTHCDNICWVSEGKYFKKSYLVVSEEEKLRIRELAADACMKEGFASLTNLASEQLIDEYHDLPAHTIEQALYTNVLQDDYILKGKILTPRASSHRGIKINELLKAYCSNKETCTVSEMEEYSRALTGANNRDYVLSELYPKMIRVARDLFVADAQVSFDISAIDELLAQLVGSRYATIKSISSFALFPPCGTTWNHYVLESFCYRFSRKYQLMTSKLNSKNTGLIVANGMKTSAASVYETILSEVLAKAEVELTLEEAGKYLVEQGLATKAKHRFLPSVVEEAQKLRKGF